MASGVPAGAGNAGDDVAEFVRAPGHSDFGQGGANNAGNAAFVKGYGRLRRQPRQKIQRPGVSVRRIRIRRNRNAVVAQINHLRRRYRYCP